MFVAGKRMWYVLGEREQTISQGQEGLSIILKGALSVLLTWCGVAGEAQVILSYPGEVPVPSRNACGSLAV